MLLLVHQVDSTWVEPVVEVLVGSKQGVEEVVDKLRGAAELADKRCVLEQAVDIAVVGPMVEVVLLISVQEVVVAWQAEVVQGHVHNLDIYSRLLGFYNLGNKAFSSPCTPITPKNKKLPIKVQF